MPLPRPFSAVKTPDQWSRAAHTCTSMDPRTGVVQLAYCYDDPESRSDGAEPGPAAGLAFDSECRLYRSVPAKGRIEKVRWFAEDPLRARPAAAPPVDLFEARPKVILGEFSTVEAPRVAIAEPRGLAVDDDDRLYVAATGAAEILIFDLWSARLLRTVKLAEVGASGPRPLDVLARGTTVYATLEQPAGIVSFDVCTEPVLIERDWIDAPSRLALSPSGEIVVLERAGTKRARVAFLDRPTDALDIPYATDIAFDGDGALVAALRPGEDFQRYHLTREIKADLRALKARGYDGLGIVRTPDGRIGYFTASGLRHAVPARVRFTERGRVTTFRLDSGEFQTVWGRLFLDACIPEGTEVRAHCVATDEPPEDPPIPWTCPDNLKDVAIRCPDRTPPLPPSSLALDPCECAQQKLHRREAGRELPWSRPPATDPFQTYEAPVIADAGRYLWVTLDLCGTLRSTPRIKCLRVEHSSHDLLRRLPRLFSRDEEAVPFLRRYLAMFDGMLADLEARAIERRVLLDPRSAPEESLPWLAGFVGLALDERWTPEVRVTLIREAVWLFRFRGTVPGLTRLLEICLGVTPVIIEHFRLRGVDVLLGEPTTPTTSSILGSGFQVGGAIGAAAAPPLAPGEEDSFATHAHRFSVIIPATVSPEERDMVLHLLELHRPAHTIFDLCTVGSGMRVGQGLHVGLSSIVGRTGGFTPMQLGEGVLGQGVVVGRPESGARLGPGRADGGGGIA